MFQHLTRIKPYLLRYRRYLLAGLAALVMTNALAMLAPLVLRRAINRIEAGGTTSDLMADAGLIVALAVGAGIFRFLVRRSVIWASRKIGYDLRGDLFRHILTLDGRFYDRMSTGDVIARATSDIDHVRMLIGPGIMQGLNTLIVTLVAIPLLISLDLRLALYALAPLPFLALATNLLGGVAHRRSLAVQESFARLSASVHESLSGIRVIKAYARERDRSRRFHEDSSEYFRLNMRLTKLWGAFLPLMGMLSGGAVVLVLYYGGGAVIDGRIDLGTLVAFTVYLGMLIWPMMALGWVISLYQRGTASLRRLGEIFDTVPAVVSPDVDPEGATAKDVPLRLCHLTFSYGTNGDRPALDDISFEIRPGETVALAGPTGSGKSTIANLLWRRYPVGDGMMFLGEVDANRMRLDTWRARVAMVAQEPFLFSQTLRGNIGFGRDGITEDVLVNVSRLAALEKDIMEFPDRYETMVGERGITLSGGQKQRATLARALALDSDLLVLDDAFSAVDAQTEREILDGLATLFGTRMIVLITHRIATLRRADRVLFLCQGKLVDSGTHTAMVVRGGAYARWVRRETLREELEQM